MRQLIFNNNKQIFSYILLLLLISIILFKIGYDVTNDNYYLITPLFSVLLAVTVFHSTLLALIMLLFLGFVGHQIIQFGAPPGLIYYWDLILILLVIKTLITKFLSLNPIIFSILYEFLLS